MVTDKAGLAPLGLALEANYDTEGILARWLPKATSHEKSSFLTWGIAPFVPKLAGLLQRTSGFATFTFAPAVELALGSAPWQRS